MRTQQKFLICLISIFARADSHPSVNVTSLRCLLQLLLHSIDRTIMLKRIKHSKIKSHYKKTLQTHTPCTGHHFQRCKLYNMISSLECIVNFCCTMHNRVFCYVHCHLCRRIYCKAESSMFLTKVDLC